MKLKVLIVDDEKIARESLKAIITENCPELEISYLASSSTDAKGFLEKNNVDIIFSDIQMPGVNGIEFINSISRKNLSVVFVTAHDHYAIKAIKTAAFDYLLKPIDEAELLQTVQRLSQLHNSKNINDSEKDIQPQIDQLITSLRLTKNFSKITIPHAKGYKVVDTDEIIFLEGNNNYTNVHLSDGTKILATRTMKELESKLSEVLFYRLHKSFVINLFHCKEYLAEDGGYAVMSNKFKVPVARGKAQELLEKLSSL